MAGLRLIIILTLCLTVAQVHTYSGGAPDETCDSLMPSHNTAPQNSQSPFNITTSTTSVKPGEQVEVTLTGTVDFRGFFLRARQKNMFIDGTFEGNNLGAQRCNGQGVTHTNPTPKNNAKFMWTAPPNLEPMPVMFVATIVQQKTLFWTEIKSPNVDVIASPSAGGSSPSSPGSNSIGQPGSVTTIASNDNVGGNNGNRMQNPGVVVPDPECNKSKGCFHDCQDGRQCTYVISWIREKDTVLFQFLYKTPSSSDKWIALGLSRDHLMDDDSVMECVMDKGKVLVKTSYNTGRFNDYPDDKSAGISESQGSVKDGVLACSYRRQIEYPGETRVFDLRQTYYLMVATGEAVAGNKFPHSYEQLPDVSSQKISLLEVNSISERLHHVYPLVKSHGTIMTFAWMFLASSGLFTARHGRSMFHNTKPFGVHVWFHIHRLFMGMSTFLTLAGFIIILVESKGYSFIPDTPGKVYRQLHPPLGLVLVVITVVNPLMAIFRPDAKSPSRKFFSWAHWSCGLFAWLVSMLMIVTGLDLNKSQADVQAIYIFFAFIGYQLIIEILVRVAPFVIRICFGCHLKECCQKQKSYDITMNDTASEVPANTGNDITPHKDTTSTEKDESALLENVIISAITILHMLVSACFTLAVLYFLLRSIKVQTTPY